MISLKAVYSVDVDPYGRFGEAGTRWQSYCLRSFDKIAPLQSSMIPLSGWLPGCTSRLVHAIAIHPSGISSPPAAFRKSNSGSQTTGWLLFATLRLGTTQWSPVGDGQQIAAAGAGPEFL